MKGECQDIATTPLNTADQLRFGVGLKVGAAKRGGIQGEELNITVSDISRRCLEEADEEDGDDDGDGLS